MRRQSRFWEFFALIFGAMVRGVDRTRH